MIRRLLIAIESWSDPILLPVTQNYIQCLSYRIGLTEGSFVFLPTTQRRPKYLMGMVVQGGPGEPVKMDVGVRETKVDGNCAHVTMVECTIPCNGEAETVFKNAEYLFASFNAAKHAMKLSATPTWGANLDKYSQK
jgi:hypothetical protein